MLLVIGQITNIIMEQAPNNEEMVRGGNLNKDGEEIISWTGRDGQLKTGTREDQKQYIEELSQER